MYDASKRTAALMALCLVAGPAVAHKPDAARPINLIPAHVEVQPRDGGFEIVSMSATDTPLTAAATVQLGNSVQIDRAILFGSQASSDATSRSIRP
jgi:hypothetical protein